MGKNSSIEWTHHTFNPWWGCTKVSPACKHCYAETLAHRFGGAIWGAKAKRRTFADEHWQEPLRWHKCAEASKIRFRVFCASMSDVFEDRRDLDNERAKLWALIEATPALDWLLLTKRPEQVSKLTPWKKNWPVNVWLGTSVENQEWADIRLPQILSVPAKVRFLSCEPLLGPVDLNPHTKQGGIHWIIAGGESGPGSRPMHPDWVRSLRDFAKRKKIPFHFKQWGNFAPAPRLTNAAQIIHTFPDQVSMISRNKATNGRFLDGRTHDEFPSR